MKITTHQFHPNLLREYDIRGIYGQTLSEADAWAIGRCFGLVVNRERGSTVVVGRDGRDSSISLENALVQGLREEGINVIRIGLGPTPLLYYAVKDIPADGGIMITGSHNPKDYNGFKMLLQNRPFFGEDIQKFALMARHFEDPLPLGSDTDYDIRKKYVERLLKDYDSPRPLKVVWDVGNGAAGSVLKFLTDQLPGEQEILFGDIDGNFPNHHPDPTQPENLEDLRRTVIETKADLGIAFDGDGDRIGVVDDEGNIFFGDHLLMLFSREVLKTHPGATIISDVKASESLFDDIRANGGKPLMWSTGHSLIKSQMAITKSPLAGEMSGHIFFADKYYGYDDALYAAIRLMNIVGACDQPLSHAYHRLPKLYSTPELRFPCEEFRKFEVIKEVKENLKENPELEVSDQDGVRVKTPDGWWLLRASNTQDVLVCRCESKTQEGLNRLKEMVIHYLRCSYVPIPDELLK
jgi:phosphomannomutase